MSRVHVQEGFGRFQVIHEKRLVGEVRYHYQGDGGENVHIMPREQAEALAVLIQAAIYVAQRDEAIALIDSILKKL